MVKVRAGSLGNGIGAGILAATLGVLASPAGAQAIDQDIDGRAQTRSEPAPDAPDAPDEFEAGKAPVPVPPVDVVLPAVEPIIPDEEFNASIPKLDAAETGDIDAPLESIEAFERRLSTQQSGAAPQQGASPPLGDPALADGDAVEEVGDAPIRDAELTRPLPALSEFDVTPVEFAEPEEDLDEVRVSYTVKLVGLDEADKDVDARLRGVFNELSALKDGDGKAANQAQLSARLTEDSELVKTILAAEGWYSPTVSTRIDRAQSENGQPLVAMIEVQPGKRYSLAEVRVEADPTVPPTLIADNLALKVGEPVVADRVQGAEAQVALALPENGYPFAEVGQRDVLLDPDTGDGVYTLPVTVGPRSRFGDITTDGDLAFGARHIDVLARFERGELYDSRKVDDLRKALVATGLFSTVSVEPRKSGQDAGAGDDTQLATIHVQQDAGPPRTIAGTAGYGTGEGFRLEASWTHRNLFPPEGALIVHGVAGTREQGAGVTFRRANAGLRDRTFELAAEALHSDFDAYSAYTGRLAARLSRDSTPIWQKKFTYAVGAEVLATAEKDYDFVLGARNRRTFFIGGLSGQLGLDFSDDLLNPTKGFRLTTLIQPEGSLEDGFNPYVRARIDGSGYYPVSDSIVLAGRVRLGTIQGADRVDIAPSRRFYAGGGGSVRGFGYQKLGPQDPNGDPIGGRSIAEGSAEVRYRFGNFGVVGFVDVGQSYAETMPKFSDLRTGVGIGGRYYTNFGPLRVDIATPLARRQGEGRINIYVSIGQAF